VKSQETQLEKAQNITETPTIKVIAIELAATTIYTHYVVTIRVIYVKVTVIRRYYFVATSNSTTTFSYVGHKDLPSTFDPTNKDTRGLTSLQNLQLTPNT
jgi:hypothetical protein